ncbi:DUF1499 domain-containing protein [Rhodobacteraceae bacterium KMM 6894]|nr:DUF1499 domain-containing protein [Rhodobacteraceae bacterium KMM 6894]
MKVWGMWTVGAVAVVAIGFAGWVRLAPTDAARWHQRADVSGLGHMPSTGGHIWRGAVEGGGGVEMAQLDRIIRATPRTTVIAGSVGAGMVTYETRSKLWGFPDYTTLSVDAESAGQTTVEIYSRLRFGTSDMGVNRDRIMGWLEAAGQG